jgi:hypothetical protein
LHRKEWIMAINTNAVQSSSVVPVVPAREPALALNAQREQTLATPPSAITRISSEGRLRAEFERRQIVAQEQVNIAPNPLPAPSANQVPANNAIPAAPARQTRDETASRVAAQARITPTDAPPPRPAAPPLSGNSADVELPNIVPQRPIPFDTPLGLQATRVSSAPAARLLSASAAVENIANTNPPATDDRVNAVRISQTANEFVAAFNAFQNRRNQALDNAAAVSQTPTSNAAPLRVTERSAPPAVESLTRPVQVSAVGFDVSTFALGVARNVAAQSLDPRAALPSQENTNDTQRLARAEVTGQPSRDAGANRSEVLPEAVNAAQFRPSAASQPAPSVAQNSAAASLDATGVGQGGLAKHLNALANLLTP